MGKRRTAQGVVVGDELEPIQHTITPQWVRAFLDAVGGSESWSEPVTEGGVAPPASLGLLTFKPTEATYEIVAGSIQTAQEFTYRAPPLIGSTLTVTGRIVDKYERRGRWCIVFDTEYFDDRGILIALARSHLIVPDDG